MKYEYIFSGNKYIKLADPTILKVPGLLDKINQVITSFNDVFPEHPVGFLYNAFTEAQMSPVLSQYVSSLYVDSGGLQIITQKNIKLDATMKYKIYTEQGNGDYAMCFDEIPLYIAEQFQNSAARTSMQGKYVKPSEVYNKGVATGNNIKAQVECFRENNFKTKVFVIMQGNEYDDWMNFCDGIFSVLTEADYPYLEGLAMADTCIGNGVLEAADMMSCVPDLRCPTFLKKRIHLLGVGSISRLLPILVMLRSGYLDKETVLSFDSTSITSSHAFGRYYSKNKTISFDKIDETELTYDINFILNDIKDNCHLMKWSDIICPDAIANHFIKSTKTSFKGLTCDEEGEHCDEKYTRAVLLMLIFVLSQLANFTINLKRLVDSDEELMKSITSNKKMRFVEQLLKIKNYSQYKHWRALALRHKIHSNRIDRYETEITAPSLESLF